MRGRRGLAIGSKGLARVAAGALLLAVGCGPTRAADDPFASYLHGRAPEIVRDLGAEPARGRGGVGRAPW